MKKPQQHETMASGFRRELLSWYDQNRRDLPWRLSSDPYRIWLSEVMLQQTRVETVIPYYHRFLEAYPTLPDLAAAQEDDVLKLWEGLGYYSRARNFLQAVREVDARYGRQVPEDPQVFGSLSGVGEYTRAAVGSIAFGRPLAVVDGNVRRVLCRLFALEGDLKKAALGKEINDLAHELLDTGRPGDYNQAVMELGALVCIPRNPRCPLCPVAACCRARAEGKELLLPQKERKKPLPVKKLAAVVLRQEGMVLVRRRERENLLKGLWEFPNGQWDGQPHGLPALLVELTGLEAEIGPELMRLDHTFSHLQWQLTVFRGVVSSGTPLPSWQWVMPEQLAKLAFPAIYQPLLAWLNRKEQE
jgi:A/G-specific adenine glycosylase